ncbi:hypothetical protein ACS0TY_033640 [Phlomoides rotata]
MKILIWNIRGVGNDISRNLLKSHCSQHRPDWLVILEPKISSADICWNYLRSLNFVFFAENQRLNKLPNIWLFCTINTTAVATVIGSTEQAILVRVQHVWSALLVGDFNAVLGAHERISLRVPNNVSCADFRDFIEQEELFEVKAVGANYTWASRRSGSGLIASKLDRILVHDSFIAHWDSISVTVLAHAGSGHHPIVLHCTKGPFKFQAAWTLDSRFRELVQQSWD